MDKLSDYRTMVMDVLRDTAARMNEVSASNNNPIETQTIFDTETDRYMVLDAGWTTSK